MYLCYRIIECNYIGITKNLKQRKHQHKECLTNPDSSKYNRKLYKYIRENELDFNNLTFKVLKSNLPDKETAEKYETTFIIFYNSIDNGTNIYYSAFTDIRQTLYQKTIKYKNYQKQYKKTDKFKEYNKNLYTKYREDCINRAKLRYQNHKDKIHKKINCPTCDLQMNKASLNRHIRRKHQ